MENHWAWIAGILEGEGCFTCTSRLRNIRCGMHIRDSDIIYRLQKLSGVGRINGPYQTKTTSVLYWVVSKKEDILYVCSNILEYMGKRRSKKIYEIIEFYAFRGE